jgi:predicted ester cyclase
MAATDASQSNERIVREMTAAIWGPDGTPGAVDDYVTEDFVDHEPGETIRGRGAYREYEAALRRGLPDLEGTLDFVVSAGDMVVARYTASGTHTGELWGVEPTGESGSMTGIAIYRLEDGRVAECWHEYDRLGMFQQLGLAPGNPAAMAD